MTNLSNLFFNSSTMSPNSPPASPEASAGIGRRDALKRIGRNTLEGVAIVFGTGATIQILMACSGGGDDDPTPTPEPEPSPDTWPSGVWAWECNPNPNSPVNYSIGRYHNAFPGDMTAYFLNVDKAPGERIFNYKGGGTGTWGLSERGNRTKFYWRHPLTIGKNEIEARAILEQMTRAEFQATKGEAGLADRRVDCD